MKKFKREVAMVLNEDFVPLTVVLGESASVIFPDQFIWKLHYANPGYIKFFVHTHPPFFSHLSEEDRTTLKAWTYALYPYKFFFLVVSAIPSNKEEGMHLEVEESWYELETLEDWRTRGKTGERKMELKIKRVFPLDEFDNLLWLKTLLELSYEEEK